MADFKQFLRDKIPTDEREIKGEFERLTAQSGLITNTSEISPFWRLVKAIAVKPVLWLTETLAREVIPAMFVKTAEGQWLELHAQALGLERRNATKAQGKITFVKFNSANALTIAKGTVISSVTLNGETLRVITTERAVIPAGATRAQVNVEAEHEGSAYNLGANYYTLLRDDLAANCEAFNADDWLLVAGRDIETDDELRDRYRLQFASSGKFHIDYVYKRLVSDISGLTQDRIFFQHDAPRGPGTANIYLLFERGANSAQMIADIERHIMTNGNHGHGDDLRVFALPSKAVNVGARLIFNYADNLSESEITNIKENCADLIRSAFRENNAFNVTKVAPFSRFAFSKLSEEIHEHFPQIRSIIWAQADIVSGLEIPILGALTLTTESE